MSKPKDDTVGQPRRATDSRPLPGSGAPEAKPPATSTAKVPPTKPGDRKPSASSMPNRSRTPCQKEVGGQETILCPRNGCGQLGERAHSEMISMADSELPAGLAAVSTRPE